MKKEKKRKQPPQIGLFHGLFHGALGKLPSWQKSTFLGGPALVGYNSDAPNTIFTKFGRGGEKNHKTTLDEMCLSNPHRGCSTTPGNPESHETQSSSFHQKVCSSLLHLNTLYLENADKITINKNRLDSTQFFIMACVEISGTRT